MPRQNHIHTYGQYDSRPVAKKDKLRPHLMRCYAANCTHYIEKHIAIGKQSRCHLCGEVFILSSDNVKRVKPRCLACSETKLARAHKLGVDVAKEILGVTEAVEEYKTKSVRELLEEEMESSDEQ